MPCLLLSTVPKDKKNIVPVFANLDLLNGPSVTGNVVFDACLVNVSMVWENLQTLACRNSLLQLLRLELCMRLTRILMRHIRVSIVVHLSLLPHSDTYKNT